MLHLISSVDVIKPSRAGVSYYHTMYMHPILLHGGNVDNGFRMCLRVCEFYEIPQKKADNSLLFIFIN